MSWKKDYFRYREYFLNTYQNYNNREDIKMFLELLLSIITIIVFLVFALRPTLITIAELTKNIKDKEETVKVLAQKIQNLALAQNSYDRLRSQLLILANAIPNEPSFETYVQQVEGVGIKNGVKFVNLSVGEVDLQGSRAIIGGKDKAFPEEAQKLTFSVNISGNYQNILAFLKELQNLRRPLFIDNISVVTSNPNNNLENLTVNLFSTGSVPYIK